MEVLGLRSQLNHSLELELPRFYGINQLVILMSHPGMIYTFWEIDWWKLREDKVEEGDADRRLHLVMRLGSLDNKGFNRLIPKMELTENHAVGSAYLEVPPGSRVCLELGNWGKDGFQPLLISNSLLIPDGENKVPLPIKENDVSLGPYYPKYVNVGE